MFLVKLAAKNIEIMFENKTIKFNDFAESKENVIEEEINSYLASFNIEKMTVKESRTFELTENQYALILIWVTTQLLPFEKNTNTTMLKESVNNIYNKIRELTISDAITTTPTYQTAFQKIQQFISLADISNNEIITSITHHDSINNSINSDKLMFDNINFDEHDIGNFVFDNPEPTISNNNTKQPISLNGSFDNIREGQVSDGSQVHQNIVEDNTRIIFSQNTEQQPLESYDEDVDSTKDTNLINSQVVEPQLCKSSSEVIQENPVQHSESQQYNGVEQVVQTELTPEQQAEQIDELSHLDNIGNFIFDKPQPTNDILETQTNDKPHVSQDTIENNTYTPFSQDNEPHPIENDVHSTSAQDSEQQFSVSVENNIHSTSTQVIEPHSIADFIEDDIHSTSAQDSEQQFSESVEDNIHPTSTQIIEPHTIEDGAHSISTQDLERQFPESIENNIHSTSTQVIEPHSIADFIEDDIHSTSAQDSELQFSESVEDNIHLTSTQIIEPHTTEDSIEDDVHSTSAQDNEQQFSESVEDNIHLTSTQIIEPHTIEDSIEDDVHSTSAQDNEQQFSESIENNIYSTSTQAVESHHTEDSIEDNVYSTSLQDSEPQFSEDIENKFHPTSTQVIEPYSIEDDAHSTSAQGCEQQFSESNEFQPYNNADQITQSELILKNQAELNAVQLLENLYQSLRSVKGSTRYCHYDPGFFARTKYKINNSIVKCGRTMFDALNLIFNEDGSLKVNSAVTALETLQNSFKEAVSKGKKHYEDYTNIAQREKMFNILKAIEKDIMTPPDQNGDPYFILNGGGHNVTYSLEGGKLYTIRLPRHAYQMHQLIENAIKGKISIKHALNKIYTIADIESSKIVTGPSRREESTRLTYEKYAQWIYNDFPNIYTNSRLSLNNRLI